MIKIPTKLKDVNFYVDGKDWMGKGEIKLPEISYKTQDVSPMGIAGTISLPNVGDLEPLKGEIKLTVVWKDAFKTCLNPKKAVMLDVRGVVQVMNPQTGIIEDKAVVIKMFAFFTKTSIGNWKPGEGDEPTLEYSAPYMKITIDGEDVFEFDSVAYKLVVNGEDLLADTRTALGK
jgi:P2 family phage contractile tail tube protein